jgi:drug/metabolite transporter (DMT)-like permease
LKASNSGYLFIFITITFTVIGQLLVKAGMSRVAASSDHFSKWSSVIVAGFLQPAVVGGLACAVLAAMAWFPALMRLPISVAYPFMALPIVLVLLLAPLCFGERVTFNQWMGVMVVSLGLWLGAR